ncbi:alpha-L-fucosidase [Paenibacillus faecalis]|uniref:alpha-L-fucosidase n=1 Tax=Paenibacillus faecalis TaxID=2079532 RepID=UPI000D0F65BC|nr:alpha-L-fucosidase [Paenibacillus faecalis]
MATPVPEARIARFEKMAFGMFIHWGLYSQLGRGEWTQLVEGIPKSEYASLQQTFTASDFNAEEIVKLAKKAGMKYITITTRHHEGFSLYDTRGLSDFDVMHSPAGRDLIAEFVKACKAEDILPVFYHTTLDWHQESYKTDFPAYLDYLRQSIEILCTRYGKIGGFWFDGDWDKPDADWEHDRLYGLIRKHQPEAMIINNSGIHHRGEIAHPEIDSVTFEQGRPEPMNREGMSKYVAAEMCETMNVHWGVGYGDLMYKSSKELIENLCACRKVGANYLLNIGPSAEGGVPIMQKALLDILGEWMAMNGEAIYEGKPSVLKSESEKDFALDAPDGSTYLFIHDLPIKGNENVTVHGGDGGWKHFAGTHENIADIRWLDNGESLEFSHDISSGRFNFKATPYPYGAHYVVRVAKAVFT